MSNLTLIAILLMLMAVAYQMGLMRSRAVARDSSERMHSRPGYYGWLVALWCGLPALLVFLIWSAVEPSVIRAVVLSELPPDMANLTAQQITVLMRRLDDIASGFGVSNDVAPYEAAAAETLSRLRTIGQLAKIAVMASLASITNLVSGA